MAKSNTPIILLVLVVATMLVATNASGCDNDINSLKETCLQFVGVDGPKLKPDQNCCNAIQRADIPCVCTYLTPEVEKVISADKVVYVAQQCGRPLKPGSKCGSMVHFLIFVSFLIKEVKFRIIRKKISNKHTTNPKLVHLSN
ncbi:Bifunctional inhibitor/lipid-transfer protein/seed storage 2S albumin superfamily protein [Rhynchospora pubera]|uniref:Bifunctional inhibitor/lipid-transfer protein/seed storage 2S albumin superfamily protein n=1 Tax=Rhynchospora pubera TaxID=906938 RepID=A0AAV8HP02_9POAL|nr:Bifunctional inhibitor/lipid-transfer protein/seed storage 2S albumin superfamily protein [Rhynchospora pubera]